MLFRANIDHVQIFQRIIQAIEKLQKKCIIKFTETEMHIICKEETEDGVQVWSQIKNDSLFSKYRIQSNAGNEINISISLEALLSTLRSAASAASTDIVMRLAKKNGRAVLCFDIGLSFSGCLIGGGAGKKSRMEHNVLIEVLRPSDMEKLKEPLCPEPDIHILLPPLAKLRTVSERMRSMSDVLAIHAKHGELDNVSGGRNGALRFSIDTDDVSVETQWTGITIPTQVTQPTQNTQDRVEADPEQWFGVQVITRAFLKFLSSHVLSNNTIACICENHCMILYVYIGEVSDAGGVLTFFIPARITDD